MNADQLVFFPTPYPDEDFRSIVHRYHIRSINTEIYESKLELLGLRSYKNTDLPRNLIHLLQKIPGNSELNAEILINRHTLFPLYRPFLNHTRLQNVSEDILYGATSSISFAGRLARENISKHIRYCPICLHQDYEKYGEVYAHRIHQIQSLEICPSHGISLVTHCTECSVCLSKNKAESLLTTPTCPRGHEIKSQLSEIKEAGFIKEILSDIQFIMDNSLKIDREMVIGKLREACWEHEYYTYSGRLTTKLGDDILLKYPTEVLSKFGFSKKRILSTKFWREMLGENDLLRSAGIYILMMRMFSPSVEEFLKRENICISNPLPYGCGPWRCMNKLCGNYQDSSFLKINRSKIKNSIHYVQFTCPECEMRFTGRWDWKRRENIDIAIEYRGQLWESKVLELYLLGLNNKEIAAEVYSSPHLIKSTLKRLLGHNYNGDKFLEEHKNVIDQIMDARKSVAVTSHEEGLIRKCREKIINIIEVNPHMSRIQIDRLAGRSYTILMKYDREWLNDILPIKKNNPNKLNYKLVDQDLSLKVQEVAQRLHYSNPSTQIKKYSILNALVPSDRSRILNHELSLPKTKSMIEKYMESKEAYLLRHVPSIVSQLKASGYRNPTFQSIVAFRRSYRNLPESTRVKIQAKVDKICSV